MNFSDIVKQIREPVWSADVSLLKEAMDVMSDILKKDTVSEFLPCITLPFTRFRWYTSRG